MDYIVMIGQFILAIIIMVGLHEAGHFMAAKAFGMRVEKFFIGFPPKIYSIKKGETEYGLGSIPLGGFVKISGMVDESMDMESLQKEPEPWEFRAKPAWQRLIVMLGGIIMNVITGIIVFTIMLFMWGETKLPPQSVKEIYPSNAAKEIGFKVGDKITKVNDRNFSEYDDFFYINSLEFLSEEGNSITVTRDDKEVKIDVPKTIINRLGTKKQFILPRATYSIDSIPGESNARKAGLKKDDKIILVNGDSAFYFDQLKPTLSKYAGTNITLTIERDNQFKQVDISVSKDTTLGFFPRFSYLSDFDTTYFSLGQSFIKGPQEAYRIIHLNLIAFKLMFTGDLDVAENTGGPIAIAKMFGSTYTSRKFWTLVGMISMILAFMNLLPIPGLDGGHVMFLLYEIITGRKPSDKFMEWAIKIGFILLISLMVFTLVNDILKL